MRTAGAKQMSLIDGYAINTLKIPSTLLMENAARRILEEALSMLGPEPGKSAAVFCGTGNNGGDGLCAARLLSMRGIKVRAYLAGDRAKLKEDAREMERRLIESGVRADGFDAEDARRFLKTADLAVDALFGTGFHGSFRGEALHAAELMNEAACPVLSVDMPSGVDADTGFACGGAVRADRTVTFTLKKPGQLIYPGRESCGRLATADIGIPEEALRAVLSGAPEIEETDGGLAASLIKRRARDSHKGNYGRAFLLCSGEGYTGAGFFAAQAAVRTGSGLVYLGVPRSVYPILAGKLNEAMVFPLSDDGNGRLSIHALEAAQEYAAKCDVCLIGPGLGRREETAELIRTLSGRFEGPLVLDADGINAFEGNIHILSRRRYPTVLTPHEGEFRRMGGRIGPEGRLEAARGFAVEHRCVLVLKGASTVTAEPGGRARINTSGNPGMARGGCGDVLAGMLTSLLGQGLSPYDAASCAAYLHGRAGDLCAERTGEFGMTPTDMLKAIPEAIGL